MGTLITIDGLDGSGKQTQSELLLSALIKEGFDAKIVSFPNYEGEGSALVKMYLSGKFSENPDMINAYSASSFFAVDRVASYILDWKEDYDKGTVIIANRYTTANAIHQLSKIEQDTQREVFLKWLYDFEFNKLLLPQPSLTFFLEVPVDISLGLIKKRSEETGRVIDIHENADHLTRAYSAALFSAQYLGWETIHCAKGAEMRSREEISNELFAKTLDYLKNKNTTD